MGLGGNSGSGSSLHHSYMLGNGGDKMNPFEKYKASMFDHHRDMGSDDEDERVDIMDDDDDESNNNTHHHLGESENTSTDSKNKGKFL